MDDLFAEALLQPADGDDRIAVLRVRASFPSDRTEEDGEDGSRER